MLIRPDRFVSLAPSPTSLSAGPPFGALTQTKSKTLLPAETLDTERDEHPSGDDLDDAVDARSEEGRAGTLDPDGFEDWSNDQLMIYGMHDYGVEGQKRPTHWLEQSRRYCSGRTTAQSEVSFSPLDRSRCSR